MISASGLTAIHAISAAGNAASAAGCAQYEDTDSVAAGAAGLVVLGADAGPDGALLLGVAEADDRCAVGRWLAGGVVDGRSPPKDVPGSADDAIVAEVAALPVAGSCLVVTADRELRRRCEALGASVAGPGWLLEML